jgi:hypothetical protein
MNRKCGCFGRFAAASVVPAKRYNQLVPSLFLDGETALNQYLDPAVERQIRKLLEYVTKNPQRGAKVCYAYTSPDFFETRCASLTYLRKVTYTRLPLRVSSQFECDAILLHYCRYSSRFISPLRNPWQLYAVR